MGYDRKPGLTTQIANGGQYEDPDTSSSFSYQQLAAESTSSAIESATEAAASAAAALVSQTSASSSATSASTSATTASAAATTAVNASNTATNAASLTAGSVTSASNSATSANTSANSASASAANALIYSNNASASASSANSAMMSAQSARDSAIAVYDNFDDRYLGPKSSDPNVDNDGNALLTGALYFNTTDNLMKVYTGSAWIITYATVTNVNLATQVSGTLGITNGGTGQTSADSAFNALAPSQIGNSGKYLFTNGSTTSWSNINSGSLLRITVFTSSGTWTKGAGTNYVKVYGVGGGGGGGGTNAYQTTAGGGGGAGGYFMKFISTTGVSTVSVTIGAGGAGGTGGSGVYGSTGGTTSFGAYCSGNGGAGGQTSYSNGGAGGTASGGTINITGGGGGAAANNQNNQIASGIGGASYFGGGAYSISQTSQDGINASAYGSGASGAVSSNITPVQQTGGTGANGVVIVEEYA